MYYKKWPEKIKSPKPTDWSQYSDEDLHYEAIGAADNGCSRILIEISVEVARRLQTI